MLTTKAKIHFVTKMMHNYFIHVRVVLASIQLLRVPLTRTDVLCARLNARRGVLLLFPSLIIGLITLRNSEVYANSAYVL